MHGHQTHDTMVAVPAAVMWDAYRALNLAKVINKACPGVLGSVDILQGDGGVGTLIKINFPPGNPMGEYTIEKFTEMDDKKRIKKTEIMEGGYRSQGFDYFLNTLEIIEQGAGSCIVRSSIEYVIDENKYPEVAAGASCKILRVMAETVGNYLVEQRKLQSS